ncbi:hypothetical protein JCM11251_000947 [Rhodosporidiobolus azoricus]
MTLRNDLPAWSLSLESYYRVFHPYTWIFLDRVYRKQIRYCREVDAWYEAKKAEFLGEDVLAGFRAVQKEAYDVAWMIFMRLYGLHYLRERYLRFYRNLAPSWDDSKILLATLDFEMSEDGIWSSGPFRFLLLLPSNNVPAPPILASHPIPHLGTTISLTPPPPTLTTQTSPSERSKSSPPSPPSPPKALIRLSRMSDEEIRMYTVPRFGIEYHMTFKPMSEDAFRAKYDSAANVGALVEANGNEGVDAEYRSWEDAALKAKAETYTSLIGALKEKGTAARDLAKEATKRFLGLHERRR